MTTSLRQVLVHLDASAAAMQRLALARSLAQQHQAALAAVYAVSSVALVLPYSPEISPLLASDLLAMDETRRRTARQAFDQSAAAASLGGTWAETTDAPVVGSFCQQALFADLLVLGQHDPDDGYAHGVPADFPESVLAGSGRAGLVIPRVGWTGAVGSNVVIAWKDTPQAARAVAGALPLLQRAAQVHVLAWSGGDAMPVSGHRLDLKGYLALHGVMATWHPEGPEPAELGEMLLSRCADLGADLLVMGCYGHSRAREWVLGGTSRTVLRHMTLPVLMAH